MFTLKYIWRESDHGLLVNAITLANSVHIAGAPLELLSERSQPMSQQSRPPPPTLSLAKGREVEAADLPSPLSVYLLVM